VIKALSTAKPDGSRSVILGLSDLNWARLRTGQPIAVRLQEMDPELPPLTVVVIGGPDEDSMFEDLRANVKINQVHGRPEEDPP
jgi:hypothetical protein